MSRITLFDDPEDDIFDGEIGEDDKETPRVYVMFAIDVKANGSNNTSVTMRGHSMARHSATEKNLTPSKKRPLIETSTNNNNNNNITNTSVGESKGESLRVKTPTGTNVPSFLSPRTFSLTPDKRTLVGGMTPFLEMSEEKNPSLISLKIEELLSLIKGFSGKKPKDLEEFIQSLSLNEKGKRVLKSEVVAQYFALGKTKETLEQENALMRLELENAITSLQKTADMKNLLNKRDETIQELQLK
jgi:hypothetical protein